MQWHDLGPTSQFSERPITPIHIGRVKLAVTQKDGQFGVISGVCNHAGGPLGEGRLIGNYVTCPWHNWKYHRTTGLGEPGYEDDDASTTNMDVKNPRFSTSDALLTCAIDYARDTLGVEARLIRLAELAFRPCEGYYSKSAHACTWPCSITQMDPNDQLDQVYEAIIHWADVIVVATPIRWGSASSLYFRMAERLNCVQNQVTIANRVLIRNKVASFIITGGQDNVQGVAGQMLMFFSELGFHFPQFPFIAHSRGWSAEDMEHNIDYVMKSDELREGARTLMARSVDAAHVLLDHEKAPHTVARGGRKAHHIAMG